MARSMTDVPLCPGCGTPAPPPASSEADTWTLTMLKDAGPLSMCADCSSSERREVVEAEARGRALMSQADPPSLDTVVFVRGSAKRLGDCMVDDLDWLAEDAEREVEQHAAWRAWFAEKGRITSA
jgi:hypothetical protein